MILTGLAVVWFVVSNFDAVRPLPPFPEPSGAIAKATSQDWGRIALDNGCVLVNNVWNKGVAGPEFSQEIFVEAGSNPGWRWRSPWRIVPRVVSQPQMACGDKPWDEPHRLIPEFPFQVGSRRLAADFDVRMRASGIYNLAFTMWAVRSLPVTRDNISHEIMIWNTASRQAPAGRHHGTVKIQNIDYDVYVEQGHKDDSGANTNTWMYVAFLARTPDLQGTLAFSAFTDYLVEQKLLRPDAYITSLELGSEVSRGVGIVEIPKFALRWE